METLAGIQTGHGARRQRLAAGNTSQREANARRILAAAWDGEPRTASELIDHTDLTRATVLSVCKELVAARWLEEDDDARKAGAYARGRPALRYRFNPDSRLIVGVDAGQHSFRAYVANLHGRVLGRARRRQDPASSGAERRAELAAVVDEALADGDVAAEAIAAVVIGAPAPVDADGNSPSDAAENFWPRMNPDFGTVFADRGWQVLVDNDANLAALAEGAAGEAGNAYATLLSGERFGVGIVVDGRLLRGTRGGVGEMRVLDMVSGVGDPHGLAHWARQEIRAAAQDGRLAESALGNLGLEEIEAHHVFAAARCGDGLADGVVEALAERLAPVVMLLSGLLDLDRIIVAGAVAESIEPVLQRTRQIMERDITLSHAELVASTLGNGVVLCGALEAAIAMVRSGPLGAGTS